MTTTPSTPLIHTLPRLILAALCALGLAAPAQATWSIILINTRTGEVAVGSATCLTGFDLQANTPVLLTGIGAATAQSFVDDGGFNRVYIRDRLLMGIAPANIITGLATFDTGHQGRQYGLCDTRLNGRAATFTGSGAGQWAGGITGRASAIGHAGADIIYAIQGNVLTGAPVVAMAEAAVLATPGDLAAKLMAAMEAARLMGGDGRCSCSQGNPTGCGSPPPMFIKSAHIAYMLIARTGDRDGCNGLYRAQTTPFVSRAADINGDSRPDMVCINAGASSSVSVYLNISTGAGQGAFAPPVNYAGLMAPRDVVVTDVTGDGVRDIVVASMVGDRATVLPGLTNAMGQPTGAFGAPVHLTAGDGPNGVATGDFNRDGIVDIAVCNALGDTLSVMLGTGGGVFAPALSIACLDNPQAIVAADLEGDGDLDIVLGSGGTAGVQIIRNETPVGGLLALTAEAAIVAGGAGIAQVRIGDIDADGDLDIVSAAGGNNGLVLLIAGGGDYAAQSLALGPTPGGVAIADVTGDGIVDLVGVTRAGAASRLGVLRGLGAGGFATPAVRTTVQNTPGRLELADVDQDGDLDALVPLQTLSTMMVVNNIGGAFNDGIGCATGDYFMEFNIANQSAGAPDPVFQLQTRFDSWRSGLVGKADAELSQATLSRPVVPAEGGDVCVQTLTIRLRDRQGVDVSAAAGTISVFHGPGSAARATISEAVIAPDGTASVTVSSPFPEPGQTGSDVLAVRIEPTGAPSETNRAVTLMPFVRLARVPHADVNLDGVRSVPDIFAFLSAYFLGAQGADYDASGVVEAQDIFAFLDRWFRGG